MGEKTSNSFEGGMKKDLDKKIRGNNTYSLGVNGRLIYNEDGSMSWENMKGNAIGVTNYPVGVRNRVIGKAEFPDFVILFSIIEISPSTFVSEIGYIIFTAQGWGSYSKLYNDTDDVLKLNFSEDHQIEAVPFLESEDLHRVYFTDDFNQPRVFTFKKISSTPLVYQAITNSAFTFDILPDFNMSNVNYEGTVVGGLLTGQYQYAYRLITNDGYATPWTPPTYNIFVNNEDANAINEQKYDFGDTDKVSNKGLRLVIRDIDTRYNEIQVAYIHSIVSAGAKEAGIFADTAIDSSGTMTFDHITTRGVEPIDIAEFSDVKDFILKAKTIAVKDNRLWFGNVEGRTVNDIPDAAFEGFYAEPEYRAMRSDSDANSAVSRSHEQGFQATRHNVYEMTLRKRRYQRFDNSDDYVISQHPFGNNGTHKDYVNYKGRQTNHSFTGYFRGEKYRFAGVFFDKKGFPMFAKHLADVTFPDAFGSVDGNNIFDSQLKAERVRADGTIQEKIVKVGLMGGAPTSGRIGRKVLSDSSPNLWDYEKNQKLYDNNSEIVAGYSTSIIAQYHLAHNAPMEYFAGGAHKPANYYYKKTTTVWGNPNDIEDGTQSTPENYLLESMLRIQGVRFGGIDLDVPVGDGTQTLKDIIGGFMIVRAERTLLDETIKDTGIMMNCSVNGIPTDDVGINVMRPRANPFMGSEITNGNRVKEGDGIRSLDDEQTDSDESYAQPNVYTFEGINHKVQGTPVSINVGTTQIKYMYDAMTSVMATVTQDITALRSIGTESVNPLALQHHWVAKFEDTVSRLKFTTDVGNGGWFRRWYKYNSKTIIKAFKDIPLFGSSSTGIGQVFKKYSSHLYFSSNDDELRNALLMDDVFDGENLDGSDKKHTLKGFNDRHLLLNLGWAHNNGSGNLNNSDLIYKNNWNKQRALAVPVVAIYEPNGAQYGGTSNLGLQSSIFHSTGHFQPVNDDVLGHIDNGGNHILNEVEIWGGDCYLDFFEYLRVYPGIETELEDCAPIPQAEGSKYRDYSCAVIYPVESKYNFKLRVSDPTEGKPIWADVGTTNGDTLANADTNGNFPASLQGLYGNSLPTCPSVEESVDVNDVLTYFDKVRSFQTKPINYIDNVDYPTRWSWSNEKQPFNARLDTFRQFEELSNFDLDGAYGEVTGNAMLFDSIYSIQEKGFGRLQVFDRAVVATQSAGNLRLGEGGIMDGIEYISKTYGSQHQWSIKSSDKNIYWADARMRKLIRFGQNGLSLLSDEMGIHSYVAPYLEGAVGKDNPSTIGGITTAYDYDNNDVLFTFRFNDRNIYEGNPWYISGGDEQVERIGVDWEENSDTPAPYLRQPETLPISVGINVNQTLIFNEPINTFTGIGTFYPTMYFNYGKYLYSNNNNKSGELYIYGKGNRGQFMNAFYYSALQYVVNKYPNVVKRFDLSVMNINEEALVLMERVLMETENNFQAIPDLSKEIVNISGYGGLPSTGIIRRAKWRQGLLKFPTREQGKRSRLTGKEVEFIVYFKNELNKKVNLMSVDTIMRLHSRI